MTPGTTGPSRSIDRDWLQKLVQLHYKQNRKGSSHHNPHLNGPIVENDGNHSGDTVDDIPNNLPIYVVAPMVDQSDLPFRLLCRRYGCTLCFTPMVHAKLYNRDINYRRKFTLAHTPAHDRPLIAQICGSDPHEVLQCALDLQPYCDGIDINCGCPQGIAKRGFYGAFLLEQPDVLVPLVRMLVDQLSIPVSVKVRLLPKFDANGNALLEHDLEASLALYRKLVFDCGISLLTIHGRTRLNKGRDTTRADWAAIRQVVDELGSFVPILANGSIASIEDARECLQATGADGIMSAEAVLEYPPLFCDKDELLDPPTAHPDQSDDDDDDNPVDMTSSSSSLPRRHRIGRLALAREYMSLAREYPPNRGGQGSGLKCIRMHLHRFLHADLQCNADLRNFIVNASTLDELDQALEWLQRIQAESGHDEQTEELTWYMRHQLTTTLDPVDDDEYSDGENKVINLSEIQLKRESTVKFVELDDDAADCFAALFG